MADPAEVDEAKPQDLQLLTPAAAVKNCERVLQVLPNQVASMPTREVRPVTRSSNLSRKRKEMHIHSPTTTERAARINWTTYMDRHLINLMINHVCRGNTCATGYAGFTKGAWDKMTALVKSKFSIQCDKDALKNRVKTFKKQHAAIKTLLEQDGFSWDDSRQMVIADDDVWNEYIKTHTDASIYRCKSVPYYKSLNYIFTRDDPDGRYEKLQDEELGVETPQGRKGCHLSPSFSAAMVPMDTSTEEEISHSDEDPYIFDPQNKRQSSTPLMATRSGKEHRVSSQGIVDAVNAMACAITRLADRKVENEGSPLIDKWMPALRAVPDIEKDIFFDACDLLEDDKRARIFLALDPMDRGVWLLRRLRP